MKVLYVFLFFLLLHSCNNSEKSPLNNEIVQIPDENFKAYLIKNKDINTNGDSEIQVSEASAFTGIIECVGCEIKDLTGIEAFTALTGIDCKSNQLTSLDVSKNTGLTGLNCKDNQLTSLDVSKNTALTYLACFRNQLTSLDVSKNIALSKLSCSDNPLDCVVGCREECNLQGATRCP